MNTLSWPHTIDIYMPGSGGSNTLARADIPAYVQPVPPETRVRLQDISRSPLAHLWLDPALQSLAANGMQVYWQNRATWWTMRGASELYEQPVAGHLEILLAANIADGLFAPPVTVVPLTMEFTSASAYTGVTVEIATMPDFSQLVLNADSRLDQTGWYYASGGVFVPIPTAGLPSLSAHKIAYVPASMLPVQRYFVRWTPYAGTTAGTVQLELAR